MNKKIGFALVFFLCLLSINVFAQSFGFDFQYGRRSGGFGTGNSISNAISSALDVVFGGIVGPVFDAIRFNFYGATKLALWIVLYLIFSNVFKKFFGGRGMHDKFSKIIAAILALFSVAFIPERLLDLVFRDLLGGLVGALLLIAAIGLPLYFLFKWGRDHPDDRAVNLISALLFFLLLIIFAELHDLFVNAFNYGFIQSLTSLIVIFGIIFALIMMIHRLYLGFKKHGGERGEERAERNVEERDEFENEKSSAQRLINLTNELRQHIHQISDVPETLARELSRNQDRLNFVNISSIHNLHTGVSHLAEKLNKTRARKNKQKAKEIATQIIDRYNGLHDALDGFSQLRRRLTHHLTEVEAALHGRTPTAPGYSYFGDLIGRLRMIDRTLKELVTVLSKVETL